MDQLVVIAAAAGPNIWGALACVGAFAAAILALVEGIGNFIDERAAGSMTTGSRLRLGSRVSASGITATAAAIVLAIDENWFALVTVLIAFAAVVAWSIASARSALRRAAKGSTA
jgi:hypothetical protein